MSLKNLVVSKNLRSNYPIGLFFFFFIKFRLNLIFLKLCCLILLFHDTLLGFSTRFTQYKIKLEFKATKF